MIMSGLASGENICQLFEEHFVLPLASSHESQCSSVFTNVTWSPTAWVQILALQACELEQVS